jgi:SAM-dependent methyltransferase
MSACPNERAQTEDFEFAALSQADNYRRALLDEFARHLHGAVIEVGAGVGQFSRLLEGLPEITRLLCLEPDRRFIGPLQAGLRRAEVREGTSGILPESEPWDAVVSVNVLEHIEEDGRELARYRRLLAARRGTLCLFVPARPELFAPLDKDFGHFRRYTRASLRASLEQAGFQVRKLRYYNLAGYFAWWLSFCLLKKRQFNPKAVRAFDRWIFPWVHTLETRLCAPPIGQSLLAVAGAAP